MGGVGRNGQATLGDGGLKWSYGGIMTGIEYSPSPTLPILKKLALLPSYFVLPLTPGRGGRLDFEQRGGRSGQEMRF